MIPAFQLRRWHRWLGVVVGVQLLLWIVSGIYFAWSDLDMIHGDDHRVETAAVTVDSSWVSPLAVAGVAGSVLLRAEPVDLLGQPTWRLDLDRGGQRVTLLADAASGAVRGPLDREEARAVAVASFAPDVAALTVDRLEAGDVGSHHEYRGKELPAWRVTFDHPSGTHVYVAAASGRVMAHRHTRWRIFDTLWMLHTMDWVGRDDINTPQLRLVSVLALAVAVSGYWLLWRTRRRRST